MNPTVLLTRPHGQNAGIRSMLEAADLRVVVMPLLKIERIEPGQPQKQIAMGLDAYDHIIFVSRNAVDAGLALLEQYWPQWPVGLRWYAVGAATAARLSAFDIRALVPGEHTSEGILALDALSAVDSSKILIVRGVGGRTTLGDELAQRGALVEYLEVYRRQQVSLSREEKRKLYQLAPIVAPVYSGETLEALAANLEDHRSDVSLVLPSRRVREVAMALGFVEAAIAESAGDDDMFACARAMIDKGQ